VHALGMQAMRGDVSGESDPARARELFERGASLGMAKSMQALGMIWYHGSGVPKDLRRAHDWWQKAAEKGDAEAAYNLGSMYFRGKGLRRDAEKGLAYWRQAAAAGSAPAMNGLGGAYLEGQGVPKDPVEAFVWFRLASGFGHAPANLNANLAAQRLEPAAQEAAEKLAHERFDALKAALLAGANAR
jgi:TPR repeat protein